MLATSQRCQLLVLDMQERSLPRIEGAQRVVEGVIRLVGTARRLGIPVTVTELDPGRLGSTLALIGEATGGSFPAMPRQAFSGWRDDALRQRLKGLREGGRDQIVLVGVETHVAVCQTGLDLISARFDTIAVTDVTVARTAEDREVALGRLSRAGVTLVTREMLAMELLERSGTPEFNDLLPLIGP